MRILVWILSFFLFTSVYAERFFQLCGEFDHQGKPLNSYKNWIINKNGSFMYIFYKKDENIKGKHYIRIEKIYNRNNPTYFLYDEFALMVDSTQNWIANKYTFMKNGDYRFYIYNESQRAPIDSFYTSLDYAADVYTDNGYLDTWYYINSNMQFCDSMSNKQLIGTKDSFKLNLEKDITIYLSHESGKLLRTDRVIGRIYQLINNQKVYYKTDIYFTEYNWQWTYLYLFIDRKGKFLVELYTEDDLFINSRIITIL